MDDGSPTSEGDDDGTPSILIVEDERPIAELYEQVLTQEYEVESVHNGGEALTRVEDGFDVVILDRRLPGMSGDEILDQMSSRDIDCRVAMVSAVDPDFDVIEMGFDDYLIKPVENDDLRETVDRLLALDEYEDLYQELSSKLVKKNIIQVEKTDEELRHHDEYQKLTDSIAELEAKLETLETDQEFDDRLLPT
jgi:DNA-binding response OmpR family regulator